MPGMCHVQPPIPFGWLVIYTNHHQSSLGVSNDASGWWNMLWRSLNGCQYPKMYLNISETCFSTCDEDEAVSSWLGRISQVLQRLWFYPHVVSIRPARAIRYRTLHGGRAFVVDPGGHSGVHHHPVAGGVHSEGREGGKMEIGPWNQSSWLLFHIAWYFMIFQDFQFCF